MATDSRIWSIAIRANRGIGVTHRPVLIFLILKNIGID